MIELTVLNDSVVDLNTVDDGLIDLDVVMATGGGSEIRNQDKTVVPTESEQSVTADAGYTGLGTVTVEAIDSEYVGSDVPRKSSSDLTASGATVNVPAGYYSASASKAVASGTEGTPTATKGAVSNHAVSVTPSVTNSAGYINGGTKTGSAVSVSASELVSGTKSISANGTEDVTNYASVSVAVQNSYSASDEGKVVDNGSLVSQTSDTVTQNDTYDTTLINSLTVNVSGGGGTDYLELALSNALTSYSNSNITSIVGYGFYGLTTLTSVSFPNVTNIGTSCFENSHLETVDLPKLNSIGQTAFKGTRLTTPAFPSLTNNVNMQAFRQCGNMTAIDLVNCSKIENQVFWSCSNLTTVILRKTSICTLGGGGVFASTRFDNGGAGGTIYIPESLYNHLGDNTSLDYKKATNWSTLNGYGTITWAKIEGSYYETHYADGTAIS